MATKTYQLIAVKLFMIQDHRIGITGYKNKIVVSLFLRCGCGKYNKGDKYRGIVCEKCGMEVKHETKIDIPREILEYYLIVKGRTKN